MCVHLALEPAKRPKMFGLDLYAGNKTNARIFLNAPNRHLDNQALVELIERGELAPLESFVEARSLRQPA